MLSVRIPLVIDGCGLWILRNQHQPPSGVSLTGVRCVTQSLESVACQPGWALLVRIIHAHTDPNKSARSGVAPSNPDIDLGSGERPGAKPTTFWSTAFLHARNADLRSLNGASLARAWASSSTKLRASALLRPPVSSARTTTQHRSAATSSEHLSSLSRRAWVRTAPSTAATCGRGVPQEVNALLRVMSTASYAPWRMGNPAATSTFRSSLGPTWTLISRNLTLRLTVAPASRQTQAKMISVGTARRFNLPDRGHAVLCLPFFFFAKQVILATALERRVGEEERQTQTFQNQGAAEERLHLEFEPSRSPVGHCSSSWS